MKKISFIVPVYNAELYIEKCINSILTQDYDNLELVLVDDGSIDCSLDKCKILAAKDSRIKVFSQSNAGVSSARNLGIMNSSGDYIAFVDSDDYIDSSWASVIKPLIDFDYDIIKYQYEKNYGFVKKPSTNSAFGAIVIDEDKKNILDMFFDKGDFDSVCTSLFKRNLIENSRFNTEYKYGEDYLFYYGALLKAKNVYITNDVLYHYVYNSESATNKKNIDKYKAEVDNHLKIDLSVYEMTAGKGFNIAEEKLLKCSYNAITTLLKQFVSEYSYKEYEMLLDFLKDNEFYKKYCNLNVDNNYAKEINIQIEKKDVFFYMKNRFVGIIKSFIKSVLSR